GGGAGVGVAEDAEAAAVLDVVGRHGGDDGGAGGESDAEAAVEGHGVVGVEADTGSAECADGSGEGGGGAVVVDEGDVDGDVGVVGVIEDDEVVEEVAEGGGVGDAVAVDLGEGPVGGGAVGEVLAGGDAE